MDLAVFCGSRRGVSPPACKNCKREPLNLVGGTRQMAQKDIQSVLQEDRVFPPSAQFREAATLKAGELGAEYARARRDYFGFWAGFARARNDLPRPVTGALYDAPTRHFPLFTRAPHDVSP